MSIEYNVWEVYILIGSLGFTFNQGCVHNWFELWGGEICALRAPKVPRGKGKILNGGNCEGTTF